MEAPIFASLIGAFDYLESCNKKIFNYGWVNFPLGYTQVATFAVYAYFCVGLFAGQFLVPSSCSQDNTTFPNIPISFSSKEPYMNHTPDMYIPVFSILEFICYMGWIKVAETLLNPWGDDDEVIWYLKRYNPLMGNENEAFLTHAVICRNLNLLILGKQPSCDLR